jgi:uncharacterized protein (DUF983 family)
MTNPPELERRSLKVLFGRALLLRCPHCGGGSLFTGFLHMKKRCPTCEILLERGEGDYFIGAYTLNLIAVEILLAIVLTTVALITWPDVPWTALQYGGVALSLLGAVFCYPFAKTTWLAVDMAFRPPVRDDFIAREK